MSDDLRSKLESLKEQLASHEKDLRQIVHEVNAVVLEILISQFDAPVEIAVK